jgi:DME family drug/metabolite transporter
MSPSHKTERSQPIGIAIAASGSILLSFGAVMIRQIETATSWQIIFFRSIGLFAGLFVLFALRNKGHVRTSLSAGLTRAIAAGPFQGLASIFFILSLTHTTIATAMMTLAATPLVVAAIGWLVLRERVTRATLMAMVVAGTGISLMTIDGVAIGTGLGSLFAIANVLSFAMYIVMLRRGSRSGDVDMLPAALVGAIVAGGVSLLALPSFQISLHDLLICLAWGAGVQTIGVALVMTSARFISAGEISLMVLFESVCGPVWAWMFVGEVPRLMTIVGGALTVVAIAVWILIRMQQERVSRRPSLTVPTEVTP